MADFTQVLPFTLQAEGGYVDDPKDPGGATNFGITLAGLSDWRGHKCTPTDVRAMHITEAQAIYTYEYWDVISGPAIPAGLDLMTFDFGVNAGPEHSVRMLQTAVGAEIDGVMGPHTITCCISANVSTGTLIAGLSKLHKAYYLGLPGFAHDGRGWTARVDACLATALALASGRSAPAIVPALPKPRSVVTTADLNAASAAGTLP